MVIWAAATLLVRAGALAVADASLPPPAAAPPLSNEVRPQFMSGPSAEVQVESLLQIGTRDHMRKLMANMTTQRALRLVTPAASDLLVGRLAGAHGHNGSKGDAHAFLEMRSSRSKAKAAAKSADTARKMLNEMAERGERKLDMQRIECVAAEERQRAMIEGARRDSSDYAAQTAAARARIMGLQLGIASLQDKVPQLNEALILHQSKCKSDMASLKSQMNLVIADVGTFEQIYNTSHCSTTAPIFLQCGRHHRLHKGATRPATSEITFSHHLLRRRAAHLRSNIAREALQNALVELSSTRHRRHRRVARRHTQHHSAVRRHHRTQRRLATHARVHKPVAPLWNRHEPVSILNVANVSNVSVNVMPTSDVPRNWTKQRKKCAIKRTEVGCSQLREKLLLMQAGVFDKVDGMKASLAKMQGMCDSTQSNYRAQTDDLERRLKDQQAALAEATSVMVEVQEQSRLMERQLLQLKTEGKRTMQQCQSSLKGVALEICGVKQLRAELYHMEAKAPFIQDCEVSAWVPEECSSSCGGGTQRMQRSVVVPASLGVACPPLVMQRKCNEQPCPVDCRLEDWGGWSACSAQCGGGVRERIRMVRKQVRHGGRPCEATSESGSCSSEACDRDCALAGWTEWTSCSKACDGGFMERHRHVGIPAKGQGICPGPETAARLEYRRCNTHQCVPLHGPLLQCTAKLDVVLLLDGSASVGEEGWHATTAFAKQLLEGFGTKVQAAVLVFSGPSTWEGYKMCTGGSDTVDIATDCKMIWASHFTRDLVSLAQTVTTVSWPKATTLTSAALASAASELRGGRPGVRSLVIAVTDGRTMDPRRTMETARVLRNKARLIWVPASRHAPLEEIKKLASRPLADNVVALPCYKELSKPETVNRVLAAACPYLE